MEHRLEEDEFDLAADLERESIEERERLWEAVSNDAAPEREAPAGPTVPGASGDQAGEGVWLQAADAENGQTDEADWEAVIEAVLFAMGNSVEIGRLAAAIDQDEEAAKRAVESLKRRYERENRGMQILELDGSYQMGTNARFYENLIRVVKTPKKQVLTDVLMETLSIVAYKQPVTKMEIARIRGVSSDHAVNRLVEYGLIGEVGRMDAPGRPMLFATTEEFLRRFGVASTEDLPSMNPEQEEEIVLEVEEELGLETEQEDASGGGQPGQEDVSAGEGPESGFDPRDKENRNEEQADAEDQD